METLLKDLRIAVRSLVRTPSLTVAALLALALGIGANTAIFSVVDGVLLRPLPYPRADRLVLLIDSNPAAGFPRFAASPPNYADWRAQSHSFTDLAAFNGTNLGLTAPGVEPERIQAARVSAGFFGVLGVSPALGRGFRAEEDRPGAGDVVVLSHRLWQRRFGAAPGIVGQRVTLDGAPHTVVGVAPEGFYFPNRDTEAWVPLAIEIDPKQRGAHYLGVIGRLADGVTLKSAQAEITGIAKRLEEQYPDNNTGWGVNLMPLQERVVETIRPALLVLMVTVGMVLLIACANVANLLLARMAAREREIAIRGALGAARGRLVRQFLTESLVLSLTGGLLGLALGVAGTRVLVAMSSDGIPRAGEIGLDWTVLGFTLGLALVTGLVFGLLPALHASKGDLQSSLREGGRGQSAGGRARLVRDLLVVVEVAAALVLLVGAGLLIRTFVGLQGISPGFDPSGVMTLRLSLPESTYPDDPSQISFYERLADRLRAVPGVEASGAGFPLPLGGSNYVLSFAVEGRPAPAPNESPQSWMRFVTPGYVQAMGIPLVRGRMLAETDRAGAPRVALVSRTLAETVFPGEDPIGHRITFNDPTSPDAEWVEIVGVVGSVRDQSLAKEPNGETYLSAFQTPLDVATVVAKTSGDPAALTGALRAAVHDVDPNLPVYRVRTMQAVVADSLADQRFNATLLAIFAALALVLASVGVYGVISYSVSQRTSEMGLRLALGAERREVLALVVRQAMVRVALGVVLGLAGAFAAGRFLRSLVVGITVRDPLTFGGVALVLLAVALLATWLPARRATRVDPVVALRSE